MVKQFTLNEYCKLTGYESSWVNRLCKKGRIPAEQVDGKWIITVDDERLPKSKRDEEWENRYLKVLSYLQKNNKSFRRQDYSLYNWYYHQKFYLKQGKSMHEDKKRKITELMTIENNIK